MEKTAEQTQESREFELGMIEFNLILENPEYALLPRAELDKLIAEEYELSQS